MVIRSAGEKRLSNFLPWQSVYAEYVTIDELWPEVTEAHYHQALKAYQSRHRRFAKSDPAFCPDGESVMSSVPWQQPLMRPSTSAMTSTASLSWPTMNTEPPMSFASYGIPWDACAGTGTLGRLAAAKPGRHLALRGISTPCPSTRSAARTTPRKSPAACTPAVTTATLPLLGSAAWLKAHEDELAGPVTLLFQPAEEGHGARKMIEDGALMASMPSLAGTIGRRSPSERRFALMVR